MADDVQVECKDPGEMDDADFLIPNKCPDCHESPTMIERKRFTRQSSPFSGTTFDEERSAHCFRCGWRKAYPWKPWSKL